MGLFWKSDSDYIIEDIQDLIGKINRELLVMQDSLIANNGASNNNIAELLMIPERLTPLKDQVEFKMGKLSSSKQAKIMVPWIDGRYYPFALWLMSYNMALGKLGIAVQRYAGGI